MADLNDGRGQIILVAAFALGVIFIALAVVVNAAIFTENLATRGEATSDSDALHYRHEVEESAGRALDYVNAEGTGSVSDFKRNLTNISLQGTRQKARLGRVVNVGDVSSVVSGKRFENQTGSFVKENSSINWKLGNNISQTRQFVLNISSISATTYGDAFKTSVFESSTGPYWNMSVFKNTTSGKLNITIKNTNNNVEYCEVPLSGNVEIDITSGTVNGENCYALQRNDSNVMWFAAGLSSPYNIRFVNGDAVSGGYRGIVDLSPTGDIESTANSENAIYSLNVNYTYQTPSLYYETDIRVAPGEPDL